MSLLRAATSGTDALTVAEVFGVYAKARHASSTLTWTGLQTAALQYLATTQRIRNT